MVVNVAEKVVRMERTDVNYQAVQDKLFAKRELQLRKRGDSIAMLGGGNTSSRGGDASSGRGDACSRGGCVKRLCERG